MSSADKWRPVVRSGAPMRVWRGAQQARRAVAASSARAWLCARLRRLAIWSRSPAAYPVYVFALTRLLFLGITYGGLALLRTQRRISGAHISQLLLSWQRWDVLYYVGIAAHGYTTTRSAAFYPLMPLLMRLIGAPFASFAGPVAYFYAGMLIANAAFLATLIVLYRFTQQIYGVAVARNATLFLAIFPKALFTFTAYSEALFLLCFLLSYIALRRRRFAWAGVFAALATLSRLAGITLLIPFAIELYQRAQWDWRAWLRLGWSAVLVPLALGTYALWLWVSLGDALAFSHAEVIWKRALVFPLETLALGAYHTLKYPFASTDQFNMGFDLVAIVIWLALLIAAALPRFRRELGIPASAIALGIGFITLTLAYPIRGYTPDLLSSMSRFLLTVFPAFIVLGRFVRRRPHLRAVVIAVSLVFLTLFTLGFVLGFYVI